MSLFWRVSLTNALVLAAAVLVLAVSPITVSSPIALTEVLVLVAGTVLLLFIDLALIRPAFTPLERLAERMDRVDLLERGERVPVPAGPELARVVTAFNAMLDRLEAERRESAGQALAAQEAERRRIARELHDEVGQTLTAVLLQLGRVTERAPAGLRDDLGTALEAARASLGDVRAVARRLRPEALDDLGLPSALRALTGGFTEQTGLPVRRVVSPDLPRLDPEAELTVFRVAQEALTNVARHAGATRAELRLEGRADGVRLTVADDGRGLPAAVPPGSGGIRNMRERALLSDGAIAFRDRPGGGLELTLDVPAKDPR